MNMKPLIEGECPGCGAALGRRGDMAWCERCEFGASVTTEGDRVILRLSNGATGSAPVSGGYFMEHRT